MNRTMHYWRESERLTAARCEFDDAELARRHIVRAPDGSITLPEARCIVEDWNRVATAMRSTLRYWISDEDVYDSRAPRLPAEQVIEKAKAKRAALTARRKRTNFDKEVTRQAAHWLRQALTSARTAESLRNSGHERHAQHWADLADKEAERVAERVRWLARGVPE